MLLKITIRNWEKFFRPRKNISSTQWFRLQNNFYTDPEIFHLTMLQKHVWVYILAEASKVMSPEIKFSIELCASNLRSKEKEISEAIKIIEELGFISKRATHVRHTCDTRVTPQNITEHNRTVLSKDNTGASADAGASVSAIKFFNMWNYHCGGLPKAKKLTADRKKKIKSRLENNPDLNYWLTAIKNLADSDFCNKSSFASLDWIIENEKNHVKAFEGNYNNRKGASSLANLKLD